MIKNHLDKILFVFIFGLVSLVVYSNISEQRSIDKSKIPAKLEENSKFQKWLTNAKNKDINVEADKFKFVEDSNIFNTIWTSTSSIDNDQVRIDYERNMEILSKFKTSEYSPNEREIVNFDNSERFGFTANQVFFYGLREDKILLTRVVDCEIESNCYFHRAGFLDNHVFFVAELSLKDFTKKNPVTCDPKSVCKYSFKIHFIDLVNNSRTVYESEAFEGIFDDLKSKL